MLSWILSNVILGYVQKEGSTLITVSMVTAAMIQIIDPLQIPPLFSSVLSALSICHVYTSMSCILLKL